MQKWMLINKNSKNKVQLVYDFFCAYKTHPSVRKLLSNYKVLSKKTCSQKSQPPQKKGTTGVLTSTCKGLCAGIASNLCACVHMHLFSGQKKLLKPIKIMNSCYYFNIKPLSENLLNTITNVAKWHSWFTAQTLMSKGLDQSPSLTYWTCNTVQVTQLIWATVSAPQENGSNCFILQSY